MAQIQLKQSIISPYYHRMMFYVQLNRSLFWKQRLTNTVRQSLCLNHIASLFPHYYGYVTKSKVIIIRSNWKSRLIFNFKSTFEDFLIPMWSKISIGFRHLWMSNAFVSHGRLFDESAIRWFVSYKCHTNCMAFELNTYHVSKLNCLMLQSICMSKPKRKQINAFTSKTGISSIIYVNKGKFY